MSTVIPHADPMANAGASMREARVELFCDHPAGALTAIRRAVDDLELQPGAIDGAEIIILERAALHVRRHETEAAVAALDAAIGRLGA